MYCHRIIIYFDGASRSNPHGPAGCGWTIRKMTRYGGDGDYIRRGKKYLGYDVSNNQAEYQGLKGALKYLDDNEISCHGLYIRGDAEIVIKQMEGLYQVRSRNITRHYNAVQKLLNSIDKTFVKYTHIDRSHNYEADGLANRAIDKNV